MNILIKNGTIVNADKSFGADILIINGKIAKIEDSLSAASPKTEIIDASGKYILPGGIDPHVHLHLPNPTGFSKFAPQSFCLSIGSEMKYLFLKYFIIGVQ